MMMRVSINVVGELKIILGCRINDDGNGLDDLSVHFIFFWFLAHEHICFLVGNKCFCNQQVISKIKMTREYSSACVSSSFDFDIVTTAANVGWFYFFLANSWLLVVYKSIVIVRMKRFFLLKFLFSSDYMNGVFVVRGMVLKLYPTITRRGG